MASLQTDEVWMERVHRWRREKDSYLKRAPHSPIAPKERGAFDGLDYYPPDPDWAVTGTARRVDAGDPVEMEMTRGDPRTYLRYARAAFTTSDGSEQEITLYYEPHDHHGHEPHEPHQLFVPFRDATSGKTTYGAGRYLEVENPFDEGDEEAVIAIDFNFAYSPFCAYNEEYACPLPPRENWLDVAVRAGEKHDADAAD